MANKIGNNNDNRIRGTSGNDNIQGRGGNDVLKGLGGDDELIGGGGHDKLFGAAGLDELFGGIGNDKLFGGDDNDSVLSGFDGNDLIEGGAGADFLTGGDGIDTLSYSKSPVGVNVALSATGQIMVAVGGDAQGDTGDGFENLTGSSFSDRLTGNDSANVLRGGAGGYDQLFGEGGRDKLLGGAGIDEMTGGAGADRLNGGSGTYDSINYNNSAVGVRVVLGKNGAETIGKGGEAKGDRITNVENIFGSQHNDVLTGNNLANRLSGGFGNDTLNGKKGADFLTGGLLDDDTLIGGKGNDTFEFNVSFGHDVIKDFKAGAGTPDVILIDTSIFADFAAVLVAANPDGDNVVITKDAGNTITLENVLKANLSADDFTFFHNS